MKNATTTFAAAALIAVSTAAAPSRLFAATSHATPPTTQATLNARYAERTLAYPQVEYVPSEDAIEQALWQLVIEKGQQVLGLSAERLKSMFDVHNGGVTSAGAPAHMASQLFVSVTLPPDVPPRAKEWLDAVVAALPKAIDPLFDKATSVPLQAAQRSVDQAHTRYADAAAKLQDLRDKIRSIAGREDVSPKSISDDISSLENQKQSLELDLMGKQARQQAMTAEIAKQSKSIQEKVQQDPIAAELQKVVDARREKVTTLQLLIKQGRAQYSELSDAIAAAADAEAKLLQRRHDAAAEAGGDALDSFNRELLTLSVDLREIQAKLAFINKRLSALSSASDQIDALTRAQDQAKSAGNDLDNAEKSLRDLRRQLEGYPTGLTLTESTNLPAPPQ